MFTDSKYTKWYFSIIDSARNRIIAKRTATLKANKLAKKLAAGV